MWYLLDLTVNTSLVYFLLIQQISQVLIDETEATKTALGYYELICFTFLTCGKILVAATFLLFPSLSYRISSYLMTLIRYVYYPLFFVIFGQIKGAKPQ